MAPWARNKFGAPVFEPWVFRKQMYCIEESTCDTVGAFRRSHSDSSSGELCPPRYAHAGIITLSGQMFPPQRRLKKTFQEHGRVCQQLKQLFSSSPDLKKTELVF